MIKFFLIFIIVFFSISLGYSYVNLSSCGTIDGAFLSGDDEVRLNQSISTGSGTCITVTVSDFILDCKGFLINSTDNNNTLIGIDLNNYDNITVQNCDIRNFGNSSGGYGLYSLNNEKIILQNINLSYNYDGFYFDTPNSTITNLISINNINDGGRLSNFRINLSNLLISFNGGHGINMDLSTSSYLKIINSVFNNNGGSGIAAGSGFSNSTISSIIVNNNGAEGLLLDYIYDNIFTNIITNNNSVGIKIRYLSSGNIFDGFTSTLNSIEGIHLNRNMHNNTFINGDIRNNIGDNFYFYDYFGSKPYNNTITKTYIGMGSDIDSNYNFTGPGFTNLFEGNYWDDFNGTNPYCYASGPWSFCDISASLGPPGPPEGKMLFPLMGIGYIITFIFIVFLSL